MQLGVAVFISKGTKHQNKRVPWSAVRLRNRAILRSASVFDSAHQLLLLLFQFICSFVFLLVTSYTITLQRVPEDASVFNPNLSRNLPFTNSNMLLSCRNLCEYV